MLRIYPIAPLDLVAIVVRYSREQSREDFPQGGKEFARHEGNGQAVREAPAGQTSNKICNYLRVKAK